MKKIDWRDVWVRAAKTFAQAFIPCLIAAFVGVDFATEGDGFWLNLLYAVIIPAAAAGVSAVWNTVFSPICKIENKENDEMLK